MPKAKAAKKVTKKKKEAEATEYTGEMARYEVLQPVDYTDENGVHAGVLEVGSIQDFPVIVGDKMVEDGLLAKHEAAEVSVDPIDGEYNVDEDTVPPIVPEPEAEPVAPSEDPEKNATNEYERLCAVHAKYKKINPEKYEAEKEHLLKLEADAKAALNQ